MGKFENLINARHRLCESENIIPTIIKDNPELQKSISNFANGVSADDQTAMNICRQYRISPEELTRQSSMYLNGQSAANPAATTAPATTPTATPPATTQTAANPAPATQATATQAPAAKTPIPPPTSDSGQAPNPYQNNPNAYARR